MFGGPWLAVLVFIVIAIGLGWGLISLFQQQLSSDRQRGGSAELDHGFDLEVAYEVKRDLMLGYLADGRIVLLPGKHDLPSGTPGKRSAVSIEAFRKNPQGYPEHIGILDAGTKVQFTKVVDDLNNAQTRILVLVRLLSGPNARKTPVLGMHLESADTDEQTGAKRYVPRSDLFERVEAKRRQVQSDVIETQKE